MKMTEEKNQAKNELKPEEVLTKSDYENLLNIIDMGTYKGINESNYISALSYKIQRYIEVTK